MTTRSDLKERIRNAGFLSTIKKLLRDIVDSTVFSGDTVAELTVTDLTVGAFLLSDAYWDDLRFPATGINPPGAASDPDIDTTDGTLLFDKASTEILAGIAQMPHSWKIGSDIHAHIHWCPTDTDTGNVYWRFEYEIQPINGVFTGYTTANTLDAAVGVANTHQIHGLATIDASAITGVSAIIKWKLSRIGNDVTDTYDNDAKLLELDFHYEIDGFGSADEFTK